MKTKKLSLNKKTIANLNDDAMNSVKGGAVKTRMCDTVINCTFPAQGCFTQVAECSNWVVC